MSNLISSKYMYRDHKKLFCDDEQTYLSPPIVQTDRCQDIAIARIHFGTDVQMNGLTDLNQ